MSGSGHFPLFLYFSGITLHFSLNGITLLTYFISALGTLFNLFTGQKPRGNEDVVSLSAKTIIWNWIYMYVHIHKRYHICLNVPLHILKHTAGLLFFLKRTEK